MTTELSERDASILYFGEAIAERQFHGVGPPQCYPNGDHEWVNLPALARELDQAFGKHGFHSQAFMHVQNIDQCSACGKSRPA